MHQRVGRRRLRAFEPQEGLQAAAHETAFRLPKPAASA
jgi:hypothetical protein